jgi:hypothetical protein
MCEAKVDVAASVAKSTTDKQMIATVPCLVDERVSISRLRVDMTSRRCDVCSRLFDSAAATDLAFRVLCTTALLFQAGDKWFSHEASLVNAARRTSRCRRANI